MKLFLLYILILAFTEIIYRVYVIAHVNIEKCEWPRLVLEQKPYILVAPFTGQRGHRV